LRHWAKSRRRDGRILVFAARFRYAAPAIKLSRSHKIRAVGSGSGGDNRPPIIGGN